MLSIRQSNRLEILAEHLCRDLASPAPGAGVLVPDLAVVQSPGMAQWLRYSLAMANGIVANVQFPLPAGFLWQVLRQLDPELPETSAFDKQALAWRLLRLLPMHLEQSEFAPLRDYVSDDSNGLKLWQLCQKIADVFDEYQVYRPDWLQAWAAGPPAAGARSRALAGVGDAQQVAQEQPWQPVLWRTLVADTSQASRGTLLLRALDTLDSGTVPAAFRHWLPPRISLFGVASLPPLYLQLLLRLAGWTDLVVYAFNPCREYWADIVSPRQQARKDQETAATAAGASVPGAAQGPEGDHLFEVGNPLLGSMGQLGRDFIDQLLPFAEQAELADGASELYLDPAADLADPAIPLLARVQQDILQLTTRGQLGRLTGAELDDVQGRMPVAADDQSLLLVDCHGPMREVEALHDHLLGLFQDHPDLTPRDVVVMVPDMATYAPAIDAVFGSAAPGQMLPWMVSDRGLGQEHPVLMAVTALLALPDSRMTLTEVLGILEVPAVQRRFGLDAWGLEQLQHWLRLAGVRWGRDLDHWQELGLAAPLGSEVPAGGANTWEFGLERLLFGYASGSAATDQAGVDGSWARVLPMPGITGQAASLVGILADVLQALDSTRRTLGRPAPALAWQERIGVLLEAFLAPDDSDSQVLQSITRAAAGLAEQANLAGFTGDLDLMVVRSLLDQVMAGESGGHRFLGGQVTLCTLMPMRTIPFRVVCLLGMNNGDYPRRDVPLGFNLITSHGRKGDRSRRLEDRYLFLEALLAARDQLYVSWSGRSARDNSRQVPSVLVSELRDYLGGHCRREEDAAAVAKDARDQLLKALTREHRLQPFAVDYYNNAPRLPRSFNPLWLPDSRIPDHRLAAEPKPDGPAAVPADLAAGPGRMLELDDLVRFLRDPPGWYFSARLDAPSPRLAEQLSDDEPFDLQALAKWQLHDQALRAVAAGVPVADALRRGHLAGHLPLGVPGQVAAEGLADFFDQAGVRLLAALQLPSSHQDLRLVLADGQLLAGRVAGITGFGLVRVLSGAAGDRHKAGFWLQLLALRAAGSCSQGWLVHRGGVLHCAPRGTGPDEALAVLQQAADLYNAAWASPPMLPPAAGHAWAAAVAEAADEDSALAAARSAWSGGPWQSHGTDLANPAALRLWGEAPLDLPDPDLLHGLRAGAGVLVPLYREADQRTWSKAASIIPWTEQLDVPATSGQRSS